MDQSGKSQAEAMRLLMAQSGQQYLPNKFIDSRRLAQQWQNESLLGQLLGYGAFGAAQSMPPNPATLIGSILGLGYGGLNTLKGATGRNQDRRLRYQGD